MHRLFLGLLLLITVDNIQAQSFKFGDISREELTETSNDRFPEANATVLYRKQFIYFDNTIDKKPVQKTEIYERIKIYNRKGFDQAAKFITLYNDEKISDLKAVTYNLKDNEISKSSFKKDSVIEIVNNSRINTSKYILSDLKEGCIIEFKYVLESDCCFSSDIPLQLDIPIKRLDVRLIVPDSLNFETIFNPNSSIIPKVTKSKRIREFSSNSKVYNSSIDPLSKGVSENIIIITNTDVPAINKEPFADIESYRSRLSLVPNQVKLKEEKNAAVDWNEISKSIYYSPGFDDQLRQTDLFQDDLKTVLNGTESDYEKAAILYNFIKLKMKWNGMDGYTTRLGIRKAFNEGIGNTADINLTLLSLLRYAGIKAYPVLINTLHISGSNNTVKSTFNYVICAADIDGNYLFLDATDELSSPNVIPLKALTGKGFLIKEDGTSKWIELIPKSPSAKKVDATVKINADLTLSGIVKTQYTDYMAANYRNEFKAYSEKDLINSIKKNANGLRIYDFKSISESDFKNSVKQSYMFNSDSEIRKSKGKLYFSPILFLEPEGNPFNTDNRNYPIDFKYPIENEYKINIVVPKGYKVEYLPKSDIIRYHNNDGEFTFLAREVGNILQFLITLKLNKTLVLPEEYQYLRQFYQSIVDKKREEVILKKSK